MKYIMVDCETWGKRPGFDLRSIGATLFDPATGYIGQLDHHRGDHCPAFYVATDNPLVCDSNAREPHEIGCYMYPLDRDPETVKWWSEQSEEAQAAFADPVDLAVGLQQFSSWLINLYDAPWDGKLNASMRIYAHGPQFDLTILEAAYHACGLPVPWHYRSPRDTRTVLDMARIYDDGDGSYRTYLSQFNTGTYHHALDDAIAQAKAMVDAMGVVDGWCGAHGRSLEIR